MSASSRKLCFDGQELVQALVMHFEYGEKQGIVNRIMILGDMWSGPLRFSRWVHPIYFSAIYFQSP